MEDKQTDGNWKVDFTARHCSNSLLELYDSITMWTSLAVKVREGGGRGGGTIKIVAQKPCCIS
jgi:hypothetical protein